MPCGGGSRRLREVSGERRRPADRHPDSVRRGRAILIDSPEATDPFIVRLKSASSILPVVALAAGGIWIAGQRHSIADLERQNALLRNHLTGGGSIVSDQPHRPALTALDRKPVDWEEVAVQLGGGGQGYLSTTHRLEERLLAMSVDELIAALDEIAKADLPGPVRDRLEKKLAGLLMTKDPELGLTRFLHRHKDDWSWFLAHHLAQWTEKSPDEAAEWFIQRIAAGSFDSKGLGGGIDVPREMVSSSVYTLLPSAPDVAGRVLSALPEAQRLDSLSSLRMNEVKGSAESQAAWAQLARKHLSDDDHLKAIAWPTLNWSDGDGAPMKIDEVTAYMERIAATPEEIAACIMEAAGRRSLDPWNHSATPDGDIETLRAWVSNHSPDLVDAATVKAIAHLDAPYPDLAEIAFRHHQASGNDDFLIALLERAEAMENKELAQSIAAALADQTRRGEFMEKFE